jgi:hypothetical protein
MKPRGCYIHFARRVRERIGPQVRPKELWDYLIDAIQSNDASKVQFMGRVSRKGRRLWRFEVEGDPFYVIYDHSIDCPITILKPVGCVNRHSDTRKPPINLVVQS